MVSSLLHQEQHQEWRLYAPLNTRNSLAIAVSLNMSASKVFFSNEGKHRLTEIGWLQVLHLICLSQGKEINSIQNGYWLYGQPVPTLNLCLGDSFINEADRNLFIVAKSTEYIPGQIRDFELFFSAPYKV